MKKNHRKEKLYISIALVVISVLGCVGLIIGIVIESIKLNSEEAESPAPFSEIITENIEDEREPVGEDTIFAGSDEDSVVVDDISVDDEDLDDIDELSDDLDATDEEYIAAIISEMTLEQKVCQMLFLTPEGLTGVNPTTAAGNVTKEALNKYPVGGLILLAQNIVDPNQISQMTTNIQSYVSEYSEMPMFIGIDEEGGRVLRVAKNDNFGLNRTGTMLSIAQTGDVNNAYEAGNYIGTYLKQYGFNVDFAPDVDVITEPTNEVIGDRSFGTDAELVADYSEAYLKGLNDAGVLGCPKHYPGHGSTIADTHKGAAVSERTWDELLGNELIPFVRLIDRNVNFIMASHIEVPAVTGDHTPTTLSPVLLTDKLRNELGYDGIIITDAMNMGAITNSYSSSEAAVLAVKAGADMLLTSEALDNLYNGLLSAVDRGELTEERIDESVMRIFKVKLKMKQDMINE